MEGLESLVVEDLIDQERMEWAVPFLHEIFSQTEVDVIASIPLSVRAPDDKRVWHWDKRGVYSVKSGYHAYRLTENVSNLASSSRSSGRAADLHWKVLWKARVPPKVRSFIWRMHKEIIPTRAALAKKCAISDSSCVFCNNYQEDALHVFKGCKRVEEFWNLSPLKLKVRSHPFTNVSAWLLHVCELLPNHMIEMFYMHMWALWVASNDVVWKGTSFCPFNTTTWATKLLQGYHDSHPVKMTKRVRQRTKWKLPPRGRLKLNTDGAFFSETGKGGIGAIIRDENGVCVAAIARPFSHVRSAIQMEFEAMRAGLLLLIHQDMDNVDIETDCTMVIDALDRDTEDLSEVGCIVEDCKAYLRSIPSSSLCSIYREANGVAHRLAHLASVDYLDDYWLDETPVIIQDVLYEDACTSTRGLGNMSPSLYNYPSIINNNSGRGAEPPS